MSIQLPDFSRIPIAFYKHVLVLAGWNQAVHQECCCLFGVVGNIVHRATQSAQVAYTEGLRVLLFAFIKPQHVNLTTCNKDDFFDSLVEVPVLNSSGNNGIGMHFKLGEDIVRNFCAIVFGDSDCVRLGYNLRNFWELYTPHGVVGVLHALRIAQYSERGLEPSLQIQIAGQNKKTPGIERLLICYLKMVREKGLEPSRLTALAPKASVSTNSTTRASG